MNRVNVSLPNLPKIPTKIADSRRFAWGVYLVLFLMANDVLAALPELGFTFSADTVERIFVFCALLIMGFSVTDIAKFLGIKLGNGEDPAIVKADDG